jgi:hypothetical protein
MTRTNLFAVIAIVVVLVGGAFAIHKFDNGQGNRTSSDVAARTASD